MCSSTEETGLSGLRKITHKRMPAFLPEHNYTRSEDQKGQKQNSQKPYSSKHSVSDNLTITLTREKQNKKCCLINHLNIPLHLHVELLTSR
jgi:hypothetical protein